MHKYRADVMRIIDGDSIVCDIDLGFSICLRATVRLYGIDCPEVRGESREKGLESKKALEQLVEDHAPITLCTYKDDGKFRSRGKYGRYLAILMGVDEGGVVVNLNDRLVEGGWAKTYMALN